MPTLPWCLGPIGVVATPLSSEIPQLPTDSDPNEIKTQDSSATDGSSGSFNTSPFFKLILWCQSARLQVLATL